MQISFESLVSGSGSAVTFIEGPRKIAVQSYTDQHEEQQGHETGCPSSPELGLKSVCQLTQNAAHDLRLLLRPTALLGLVRPIWPVDGLRKHLGSASLKVSIWPGV